MRQLLAKVNKARDLIQLGAYQPGHDAELDTAVRLQPQMKRAAAAGHARARHPARSGRSAPIELLRCHVGFMQRLHQAQTQQKGQLQAAQARVVRQKQALMAMEMRLAAVRKLVDRRSQERQRTANTLEQRRHDEAAQQRAWHTRADTASPQY
jgi:flagellar export protein FliJ